ncbi:MAG TPA: hypothetical protein H9875_06060 [Candidatus Levilactobacillus faecigallinarum]|uniref:Extracellular protein n=1 Tax=Candidatus Levilactobacillus faecigallinarum TaxID=2838638 RepID=A0A9D1QU63_9LACO|nr:hypothetical protein [Candidatus Levilactobacillus faecigallinarum]
MHMTKFATIGVAALSLGLAFSTSQSAAAKTYKVHKAHYTTAKVANFSSSKYRTGYLTNQQRNYTFYQFSSTGTKTKAFKIKNALTPLKVKKNGKNSKNVNVYDIIFKGQHATEAYWKSYSTVYPYNSQKLDSHTIVSPTTPYSGKAVLPHGTKTSKLTVWMTDNKAGNKNVFYHRVKGGWKYSGTM